MSASPLLPREDAREAALFFVVCALCFLAALAALSARAAYSAANDWTNEVTGQITIRIEGEDDDLATTLDLVRSFPGILTANALNQDDAENLLSPWLGQAGVPEGLPLPRLIAASADPTAENLGPRLSALLRTKGIEATVDDHVQWTQDVREATQTARLIALGAVALLICTALAVIAFATHAALLARKDIVDVLHLCGARDGFIAGLFERRFLTASAVFLVGNVILAFLGPSLFGAEIAWQAHVGGYVAGALLFRFLARDPGRAGFRT